jgi:hypothetical protein
MKKGIKKRTKKKKNVVNNCYSFFDVVIIQSWATKRGRDEVLEVLTFFKAQSSSFAFGMDEKCDEIHLRILPLLLSFSLENFMLMKDYWDLFFSSSFSFFTSTPKKKMLKAINYVEYQKPLTWELNFHRFSRVFFVDKPFVTFPFKVTNH